MRKYIHIRFYIMPPKSSKNTKQKEEPTVNAKVAATDSLSELKNGDIALKIAAKPGSKESSIVGNTKDGLEVKIGAPAVDGEANAELIAFLSKVFGVRKSDVNLDKGSKNRSKIVTISKDTGLSIDRIREIINLSINK